MKKIKVISMVLAIVMILSQGLVFAEESYAVEIGGSLVATELKLTLEELKGMPEEAQINQAYTYNSKGGEKTVQVKGVSLAYLLKEKAGVTAALAATSAISCLVITFSGKNVPSGYPTNNPESTAACTYGADHLSPPISLNCPSYSFNSYPKATTIILQNCSLVNTLPGA
jgi:hypothetical protein